MIWNFQATVPTFLDDEDTIDRVGFKLFCQYVARANELVMGANPNGAPLIVHSGETFAAVVPVPDPTADLFATAKDTESAGV